MYPTICDCGDHSRRSAAVRVARSLFTPTTLQRALETLGFVQADPIRAPARAQDLTLRHRVRDYRAGDLERRYTTLDVEEDFFINYGFITRSIQALMHPRADLSPWPTARMKQAKALLEFVRERGPVHPRDVDRAFLARHGDELLGRIVERHDASAEHALPWSAARGAARRRHPHLRGARSSAPPACRPAAAAAAARRRSTRWSIVSRRRKYAPLPGASLSALVSRLRYGVPQWHGELQRRPASGQSSDCRMRMSMVWTGTGRQASAGVGAPGDGPPAGAFRSGRLGPPPFRAAMGLGV